MENEVTEDYDKENKKQNKEEYQDYLTLTPCVDIKSIVKGRAPEEYGRG